MKKEKIHPKNKYDFTCPVCGQNNFLMPSIFMLMGINIGGGNCTKCKTYLQLEIIDIKNQKAKAIEYEKFVKQNLPIKKIS